MLDLNILKKEIATFGIKYYDNNICYVIYNKKFVPIHIKKYIKILNKRIQSNRKVFEEVLNSFLKEGLNQSIDKIPAVDSTIKNMYINSVKEFNVLFENLVCNYEACEDENNSIILKCAKFNRQLLFTDIKYVSKEFMLKIIDYKICVDSLVRLMDSICYIIDILKVIVKYKKIENLVNKIASGISSHTSQMGNLDLPMGERVFSWNNIRDEIMGRDLDRKKQRRYRFWMENYHSPGVGEGFYYRDFRNEPYSWQNRYVDGTTPYLKPGTWR